MLCQQIEQGEFGAGELQGLTIEAGFLAAWIQAQGVDFYGRRTGIATLLLFAPVGTAQNSADTRDQLTVVKGFR